MVLNLVLPALFFFYGALETMFTDPLIFSNFHLCEKGKHHPERESLGKLTTLHDFEAAFV